MISDVGPPKHHLRIPEGLNNYACNPRLSPSGTETQSSSYTYYPRRSSDSESDQSYSLTPSESGTRARQSMTSSVQKLAGTASRPSGPQYRHRRVDSGDTIMSQVEGQGSREGLSTSSTSHVQPSGDFGTFQSPPVNAFNPMFGASPPKFSRDNLPDLGDAGRHRPSAKGQLSIDQGEVLSIKGACTNAVTRPETRQRGQAVGAGCHVDKRLGYSKENLLTIDDVRNQESRSYRMQNLTYADVARMRHQDNSGRNRLNTEPVHVDLPCRSTRAPLDVGLASKKDTALRTSMVDHMAPKSATATIPLANEVNTSNPSESCTTSFDRDVDAYHHPATSLASTPQRLSTQSASNVSVASSYRNDKSLVTSSLRQSSYSIKEPQCSGTVGSPTTLRTQSDTSGAQILSKPTTKSLTREIPLQRPNSHDFGPMLHQSSIGHVPKADEQHQHALPDQQTTPDKHRTQTWVENGMPPAISELAAETPSTTLQMGSEISDFALSTPPGRLDARGSWPARMLYYISTMLPNQSAMATEDDLPYLLSLSGDDLYSMIDEHGLTTPKQLIGLAFCASQRAKIDVHRSEIEYSIENCGLIDEEPLDLDMFEEAMYSIGSGLCDVGITQFELLRFFTNLAYSVHEESRSTSSRARWSFNLQSPVSFTSHGTQDSSVGSSGSSGNGAVNNGRGQSNKLGTKRESTGGQEDDGKDSDPQKRQMLVHGQSGSNPQRDQMPCVKHGCLGRDPYISGLHKSLKDVHKIFICQKCYRSPPFTNKIEFEAHSCSDSEKRCVSNHSQDPVAVECNSASVIGRAHAYVKRTCGKPSPRDLWQFIFALCNPDHDNVPEPEFIFGNHIPHSLKAQARQQRNESAQLSWLNRSNPQNSHDTCEYEKQRLQFEVKSLELRNKHLGDLLKLSYASLGKYEAQDDSVAILCDILRDDPDVNIRPTAPKRHCPPYTSESSTRTSSVRVAQRQSLGGQFGPINSTNPFDGSIYSTSHSDHNVQNANDNHQTGIGVVLPSHPNVHATTFSQQPSAVHAGTSCAGVQMGDLSQPSDDIMTAYSSIQTASGISMQDTLTRDSELFSMYDEHGNLKLFPDMME